MSTENEDENEVILDTRSAGKVRHLTLIMNDGSPDGKKVRFTIKPLSADAYLQMQTKQAQLGNLRRTGKIADEKLARDVSDSIDAALVPLVTPQAEFKAWVKANKTTAVYQQVLDKLTALSVPNLEVMTGE